VLQSGELGVTHCHTYIVKEIVNCLRERRLEKPLARTSTMEIVLWSAPLLHTPLGEAGFMLVRLSL